MGRPEALTLTLSLRERGAEQFRRDFAQRPNPLPQGEGIGGADLRVIWDHGTHVTRSWVH